MTGTINHTHHLMNSYRREVVLLDGRKVAVRPICSEDKAKLLKFHSFLSDETRFLRYQYLKGDLTEDDLKKFCDIDYEDSLALVAETGVNGHKEIIGVGRYFRLPCKDMAEVAFVVRDCDQKKGVGTQLLRQLAILADKNNIRYFVAEVLRMNSKMLSIFRKSDPELKFVAGEGNTCTVTISVSEAAQHSPCK